MHNDIVSRPLLWYRPRKLQFPSARFSLSVCLSVYLRRDPPLLFYLECFFLIGLNRIYENCTHLCSWTWLVCYFYPKWRKFNKKKKKKTHTKKNYLHICKLPCCTRCMRCMWKRLMMNADQRTIRKIMEYYYFQFRLMIDIEPFSQRHMANSNIVFCCCCCCCVNSKSDRAFAKHLFV